MSFRKMSETVTPEIPTRHTGAISKERLHQYQEQRDLEITFQCKDGQQLCSRQILASSDWLYTKANKMTNFENSLTFNYPDHSKAAVKFFLDSLHQVQPGRVDLVLVLEVVDFAQCEGQTTYDSFERGLVERLMASIIQKQLPLGTQLLIGMFLSRVDNYSNLYQQKVAKKLTKQSIEKLFFGFDPSIRLNQRLIEMCVAKRILTEDTPNVVTMALMMYGTALEELQHGVSILKPESFEKVMEYKFSQEVAFKQPIRKRNAADILFERRAKRDRENTPAKELTKMNYGMSSVPRSAFTWLDDTFLIVTAVEHISAKGDCIALNTSTGESRKIDVDEETRVDSVARLSDDTFITASGDNTVTLFINGERRKTKQIEGESFMVQCINGEIVTSGTELNLTILNENLETKKIFKLAKKMNLYCDWNNDSMSGNEDFIAVGYDNYVSCYRRHGVMEPMVCKLDHDVHGVSVQGNLLAIGSADGMVQVWNMETHSKVWQFQHDRTVNCVQLQNKQLISCSDDEATRIWDLDTGKEVRKLSHDGPCNNFDISPSKTILAVACGSGVVLWNFRLGTKMKEFKLGHKINDLRFNPAGNRIVAGSDDGRVFKIDLPDDYGDKDEES